jgi:hypothetical protein
MAWTHKWLYDYVTSSSANKFMTIKLNCEIYILKFKFIWDDKIYSKFNISPILGLKITNSPSRNPTHQRLSKSTKISPLFYFILFKYNKFVGFFFNCSIFNNSYIVSLKIMKPPWCTPSHWKLSKITKSTIKGTMVWEISTWQTKQTNNSMKATRASLVSMTFSWHQIGRYKKTWDNIHVFITMSCQCFVFNCTLLP